MEEFYTDTKTPFLCKHRLQQDDEFHLSASTFAKSYQPRKRLVHGQRVAVVSGGKSVGKVVRTGKNPKQRKSRSTWVWLTDTNGQDYPGPVLLRNVVAIPEDGEFVRHKTTKRWFKCAQVDNNNNNCCACVLIIIAVRMF